mgnify:CR=1 FL=1
MLNRFYIYAVSIFAIFYANITYAQSPFVSIKLQNGISFELPRNWKVIDLNTRTTLDASVAARSPIDINSALPFAANLYNSRNQTISMVNVRIYPNIDVYQQDVKKLSRSEILEFDNSLEKNVTMGVELSGSTLTNWYGTEIMKIGDKVYLLSKYRRRSGINKNNFFRVSLLRLLDGKKSFTLTLSYEETEEYFLKPIIVYIIKSVKLIR